MSDVVMKDMLLSLCSSLQADMLACFKQNAADIPDLKERVDHLEEALDTCVDSYNNMVDAHTAHSEEIAWLKSKVADLEDRSRRSNLKLRGAPESIQPAEVSLRTRPLSSGSTSTVKCRFNDQQNS